MNPLYSEFFDYILNDPYLSTFITSYENLSKLQKSVQNFIDKFFNVDNEKESLKLAKKFAKIHVDLKINYSFLVDALDYFYSLLVKNREFHEYDTDKIKNKIVLLKNVFAEEYIKSMLSQALESLTFKNRKENFGLLKNFYDFVEGKKIKEVTYDHTQCNIGKYIRSIEFLIKSSDIPKLRLKLEVEHKKLHEYASMFLSFYHSSRYQEAIIMLDNFIKSSYLVFTLLQQIELYWEENKEKSFAKYLHKKVVTEKGFVGIVIESTKNRKIESFVENVLGDVRKFLKKYQNNFAFLSKHKIYVYFSKENEYLLNDVMNEFKKFIIQIADKYSKKYETVLENPIFKVGIINTEYIENTECEVISKLFLIIERELEKIDNNEIIIFKDFTSEVKKLFELSKKEISIEKSIIESIKNRNFYLFAQKLVDTLTKETKAIEILSRIKQKKHYIAAEDYINVIQENDLTLDMDISVFEKLLNNLDKFAKISKRIFVNIFPTSLNSNEFLDVLKKLLKKAEELKLIIVMELTEHTLIENYDVIKNLNSSNLQIAFDDFGSGFTNYERVGKLALLKESRVLKIDGDLVKRVKDSKIYLEIVKNISSFAKSVGLEVVYEYVENETVYNILREITESLNLESYIQGFYFSKPSFVV
jgi:EAL domain-containing protein (putative c-di-GMP-specific phosphodiesterase class I)